MTALRILQCGRQSASFMGDRTDRGIADEGDA